MKKRGQMRISFGLIFSIILIIVFLAFAIFGIGKFLGIQGDMKAGKLINDLQVDIDDMWKSSKGSQKVSYPVPKETEAFCFEKQEEISEDYNAYFIPLELGGGALNHVNWGATTRVVSSRILCVEPKNSKITLILEKDYGEEEVTIIRPSNDESQSEEL